MAVSQTFSASESQAGGCDCQVYRLLTWESPAATVAALAACNSVFLFSFILNCSFLALLCIVGAMAMIVGFVLRLFKGSSIVPRDRVLDDGTKQKFMTQMERAFEAARGVAHVGHDLITWRDGPRSAYTFVGCVLGFFLLKAIALTTAIFLLLNVSWFAVHISAFYKLYCASYVLLVHTKIMELIHKIPRVLPGGGGGSGGGGSGGGADPAHKGGGGGGGKGGHDKKGL